MGRFLLLAVTLVACVPPELPQEPEPSQTDASPAIPTIDAAAEPAVDAPPPPDAPPDARACAGGDGATVDASTGSCFVVFRAAKARAAAEADCVAQGMHLATILSGATNLVVRNLAGNVDVFIGATDVVTEGVFLWPDGTGLTFAAFRAGEPNNGGGQFQEDCLVLEGARGGTWDDRPCAPLNGSGVFPYVCQF